MSGGFRSVLGLIWRYFKLAFGALLVLISVNGLVLPKSDYLKQYENLEHEGLITPAVVTKKTISESAAASTPTAPLYALGPVGGLVGGFVDGQRLARATRGERGPTNTYYYVEYQFTAKNKDLIKHKKKVDFGRYQAIKVGAKLSTLYHPLNPKIHRLTDLSDPGGLGMFLVWRNWHRRGPTPTPAPANRLDSAGRVQRVPVAGAATNRRVARGAARGPGFGRRPGFGQRA